MVHIRHIHGIELSNVKRGESLTVFEHTAHIRHLLCIQIFQACNCFQFCEILKETVQRCRRVCTEALIENDVHNCAIPKIPFDISHLHLIFHNNTMARTGFTHIFLESQGLGGGFIRCYILRTGSCLLRHHTCRQKQQHEQHQWEQSESTDYRPPHCSYGRLATQWIDW